MHMTRHVKDNNIPQVYTREFISKNKRKTVQTFVCQWHTAFNCYLAYFE